MSGKAEANEVRANQGQVADTLDGLQSDVAGLGADLRSNGGGSAAAADVAAEADRLAQLVGLASSTSDYVADSTDADQNEQAERFIEAASRARGERANAIQSIRNRHAVELEQGAVFGAAGLMSSLSTSAREYGHTEADVIRLTSVMMDNLGARAEGIGVPYYRTPAQEALSGLWHVLTASDNAGATATLTIQHLAAMLGINFETPEGLAQFRALAARLGGAFLALTGLESLSLTNGAMRDVISGIAQANEISLEDFRARYQGINGWFRQRGEEWAELDIPGVSHAFVALEGFMAGMTDFGYQTLNGLKTLVIDPTEVVNGDFLKNTWDGIFTSFTDLNPVNLFNGHHGNGEYDGLLGYSSSVGNVTGAVALSLVTGGAAAKAVNVTQRVAGGASLSAAVAAEARALVGSIAGSTAGKLDFAARAASHVPGMGDTAVRFATSADNVASWGKNVANTSSLIDNAAAAAIVDGRRGNVGELGIRGAVSQSIDNAVAGIRAAASPEGMRAAANAVGNVPHRVADTVRDGGALLNGAAREAGAVASGHIARQLDAVAAHLPENGVLRSGVNGLSDSVHSFGNHLDGRGMADRARLAPYEVVDGPLRRFEPEMGPDGGFVGMRETTPEVLVRRSDNQWISPDGDPLYPARPVVSPPDPVEPPRIVEARVVAERTPAPEPTRHYVTEEERIAARTAVDEALNRTDFFGNPNPSIRFADARSLDTVIDVVEQAHARIPEYRTIAETPGPIGQRILELAEDPPNQAWIYLRDVLDENPTGGYERIGYKVHIYAESMADVAEIADRVVPGLAEINANAKFHDGTQSFAEQPKGATIYFDPERPLVESVNRVLEDLGEWKSGTLTGDIDLTGGVGLRYDGAIEPGVYGDLIPPRYTPETGMRDRSMLELEHALQDGMFGDPAPARPGWPELMNDWASARDMSISTPNAHEVGARYLAGMDADAARAELGLTRASTDSDWSQWAPPDEGSAVVLGTPNERVMEAVPNGGIVRVSNAEQYYVTLARSTDSVVSAPGAIQTAEYGVPSLVFDGEPLTGNVVSIHGTPTSFVIPGADGQMPIHLSAKELADHLRAQPGFIEGEPVYLISCETGSAYLAQQLANELGVTVHAPEFVVGISPNYISSTPFVHSILDVNDPVRLLPIVSNEWLSRTEGLLAQESGLLADGVRYHDGVTGQLRAYTSEGVWKAIPLDDLGRPTATYHAFDPHSGLAARLDTAKALASDLVNSLEREAVSLYERFVPSAAERPLTLDDFDPRAKGFETPSAQRTWNQMHAELTPDDASRIAAAAREFASQHVATPDTPILSFEGRMPETLASADLDRVTVEPNAWTRPDSTNAYEFTEITNRPSTTFEIDPVRTDALVTRIAESGPVVVDLPDQGTRVVVLKGEEFIGQGGVLRSDGSIFARDLDPYLGPDGGLHWADGTLTEGLVVHLHAGPDGFLIRDGGDVWFGPHELASYLERSGALDGLADGAPITIAGCELPGPIAQELSDILGRPVISSYDTVLVAEGRIGTLFDDRGDVPPSNAWVLYEPNITPATPSLADLGTGPIDAPWEMPHYSGHDPHIAVALGDTPVAVPSGIVDNTIGRLFRIEGTHTPDATAAPMPVFHGPAVDAIVDDVLGQGTTVHTEVGARISLGGPAQLLDADRHLVLGESTVWSGDVVSAPGDPSRVTLAGEGGVRAELNPTEFTRQLERTGSLGEHRPLLLAEPHSDTFAREVSLEHASVVVTPATATTVVTHGDALHLVGYEPVTRADTLFEASQHLDRIDDLAALDGTGRILELRDEADRLRYFVDERGTWQRVVTTDAGEYVNVFSTVDLPETRSGVLLHEARLTASDFGSGIRGAINDLPEDHLVRRGVEAVTAPTGIQLGQFDPANFARDLTIEAPAQRNPVASLFELSADREFAAQLVPRADVPGDLTPSGPVVGDAIDLTDAATGNIIDLRAESVHRLDPHELVPSQQSIAFDDVRTLAASMTERGWDGPPIDVVQMPDGTLVAADHRRMAAARLAGIDVEAVVHQVGDPIPEDRVTRAMQGGLKKWRSRFGHEPGALPQNWGEYIEYRAASQPTPFTEAFKEGRSEPLFSYKNPYVDPDRTVRQWDLGRGVVTTMSGGLIDPATIPDRPYVSYVDESLTDAPIDAKDGA